MKRPIRVTSSAVTAVVFALSLVACDDSPTDPKTRPGDGPPGDPRALCDVPADAMLADASHPTTVVGDGTKESCTSAAVVSAVAAGGIITFDCGPDPIVITMTATAKVFNDASDDIVIDGGGKVTLSGAGARRILYMNTCDEAQHWTSPTCQNQATPRLVVQNLTFVDGNSTGETKDGGGGGAIFVRGGRLRIVNSRFFHNLCDPVGPDLGGGAVRTLSQYENLPVYVVNSTFGGDTEELGNSCSNGGALSNIGVSYTVVNSTFRHNTAIGDGANPKKPGTPGGGSGGAIYNDGDEFTLAICGSTIEANSANEGGGAVFFVSNDLTGSLVILDSTLRNNVSSGFETDGYPGIFVLADGAPVTTGSTLE